MGERSYQESLHEVQATLHDLETVLGETSPSAPMRSQVRTELANVTRRIKLLAYAAQKSRDQSHVQWHEQVRNEVRGEGHAKGIEYSPKELRSRARVS